MIDVKPVKMLRRHFPNIAVGVVEVGDGLALERQGFFKIVDEEADGKEFGKHTTLFAF